MMSSARVVTTRAACRSREAACLALLGLAAAPEGAAEEEAEAVIAHVADSEWRAPAGLVHQAAAALVAADLVTVDGRGRLHLTQAGQDALHCLLVAPVALPDGPVERVVLSLRLCLLDRLPEPERATQAHALAAIYGRLVEDRRAEAERFAAGLPLLGVWSRERRRRLEAERDLCARVRDLLTLDPGPMMASA